MKSVENFKPHPRFEEAVVAIDAGDAEKLRRLLESERGLVHARTNLEPPYHYFTGATLLHHVAGNPDRGRLEGKLPVLPKNISEIARLLIERGADVNAVTLGPNGGSTMGLVLTSKQASDADVAGALIDVLLKHGAELDLKKSDCLDGSLANHSPRSAEKLIELGAKPDLFAAAALGRMDWLRLSFDANGTLLTPVERQGQEMKARDAIGLAMLYAYVREQHEAVNFLLTMDGNWNMTGVNNGTALHRAAWGGDLEMVMRLVAKGADVNNRDNPYLATPLSWARHNHQQEVADWLQKNAAVDLHDAAAFGLPDQATARIAEDPSGVNRRIDQWEMQQCTPLHCAAYTNHASLAKLLLAKGADPSILTADQKTPFDIAMEKNSAEVIDVLEKQG